MNILIEGFEEDIKELLISKANEALKDGLQAFRMWAVIVGINAELSIEGNNVVIRKEATNE